MSTVERAISGDAVEAEVEIRAMLDAWAAAVRSKDVDDALAGYAEDVTAFDLIDPLVYSGLAELKDRLGQWLGSFEGEVGFEQRDVAVVAGSDVAFVRSLNHVSGTTASGDLDMWWRATLCLRRAATSWEVAHSHTSVPFDMQTGEASLGLTPTSRAGA